MRWVIVLLCMALVPVVAYTDEPYVEAWATKGMAYTQYQPEVTENLWHDESFWGAEIIGRYPISVWGGIGEQRPRFALFGRFTTEGAPGTLVYNNPATWNRAIVEGGAGFTFLQRARYSCSAFAGYGTSLALQTGERQGSDWWQAGVENMPERYGGGVHCRDDRYRMWAQARVERDPVVGDGAVLALTVHAPLFTDRIAVGVDAAWGDVSKVNVKLKALLWRK